MDKKIKTLANSNRGQTFATDSGMVDYRHALICAIVM